LFVQWHNYDVTDNVSLSEEDKQSSASPMNGIRWISSWLTVGINVLQPVFLHEVDS